MVSFRDPGDDKSADGNSGEKIAPVTYLRGAGHQPGTAEVRANPDAWFGSEAADEPAGKPRQRPAAGTSAGHLRAVSRPDENDEPDEPIADPEAVETLLVRKLARKSLSEAEVLAFGVQEGLTAAQANSILDRMRGLGYVDDRALAEQLKHSLSERKGQSKAVVARAMSGRSIDRDIINEVLDDIEQEDELGVATELARKRASQMSGLDKQTLERRLTGFLARRGYPGHIVREAIAPVLIGRSSSPSSTVRFR
ncbi:regulatory protein RecX [Mycetocola zhadangensis]|uniref:Regulatory protein RecX n=1 Tax=Mycetocola zhadangensis TaxID=1164595 RepID=A0A3L7ISS0_9MICO|nr:regulatory protein RecX [Mycetocola zhadangensis]RLQ81286.1 RecX family transcriptional regulator [Mycetocola zhadangensis]GGF03058.1 hypothetical protein GCM10011313_27740 [Mycetocola zhadangensis]